MFLNKCFQKNERYFDLEKDLFCCACEMFLSSSGSGLPGFRLLTGAGEGQAQVRPLPEDGSRERSEWSSRWFYGFISDCITQVSPATYSLSLV